METVAHHGTETAVRHVERGDGPTLCLVHGSGGSHRVWANQYGPSGFDFPVAAVDLSGHGDSDDVDSPPGPETLNAYARDVAAVADVTGADVLVGNSLGGAVVLHAVLEGHCDPAAVVLGGSGAKLAVLESLRELLADDFPAAVEFLHGEDRLFHDADPETVERSRAAMREAGQEVTRRDFLTCHEFDVRDRLDEVTAPTLAVCGEHDQLTPPSYHEYLAERVRDGMHRLVPDAAHLAMVERPRAFEAAVTDFLDSVEVV